MILAQRRAQRDKWYYAGSADGGEGKALSQKQRTVVLEVNLVCL